MKTAIIMADGVKQVMLTPENESEKEALKILSAPGQDMSVDFIESSLYDNSPPSAQGYTIKMTQGGALRAFTCEKSLMIVLRSKTESNE